MKGKRKRKRIQIRHPTPYTIHGLTVTATDMGSVYHVGEG